MKGKFTPKNYKETLTVMGYVAISAVITALIDFIPSVELGVYAPIVMGLLNTAHVAIKKLLSSE